MSWLHASDVESKGAEKAHLLKYYLKTTGCCIVWLQFISFLFDFFLINLHSMIGKGIKKISLQYLFLRCTLATTKSLKKRACCPQSHSHYRILKL